MFRIAPILILLLSLCSFGASAQSDWYNSDGWWQRLKLEQANIPPLIAPDTAIIVASNRAVHFTQWPRFISEERDGDTLRYYYIYALGGKWHVVPVSGLKKALVLYGAKHRDWVVYTEGMGKIFTSGIDRAMRMNAYYKVNIIYLDYPSITTTKTRMGNYLFAMRNARVAYKDFLPVLDTIRMFRESGSIRGHLSLFFHSMGNNVLRELVRKEKTQQLNGSQWVDNLILNAACVPQKHHAEWLGQVQFAKHIYINYNPEDRTLAMASLMTQQPQLGQKVQPPMLPGATYINFHTLADDGHSMFLSLPFRQPTPKAATDYYRTILHGDTPPLQDSTRFRPTAYRGLGLDILPFN